MVCVTFVRALRKCRIIVQNTIKVYFDGSGMKNHLETLCIFKMGFHFYELLKLRSEP
jgi:hypothetical protein